MTLSSTPRPARGDDDAIDREDLEQVFYEAHKPRAQWRVGAEAEKFGVVEATGEPLAYDGPLGVCRVLERLVAQHGWAPQREAPGAPVIALRRGAASVTLEPGAQLELSGAPLEDIHQVAAELDQHYAEIEPIARELGVVWLGTGFHPLARQEDLSWVPKQRYAIMREFLPPRGHRALDMMRRTATVQANLDYASEEDAMRKLRIGLRLAPLLHAMTANAPFVEGRLAGRKSERGEVWRHMDPSRSGLIAALWRPGAR